MAGFTSNLLVVMMSPFRISPARKDDMRRYRAQLLRGPLRKIAPSGKGLRLYPERGASAKVDAAYVLLGCKTPKDAVAKLKDSRCSRAGFLLVNSHQETSIPGLFAVGDCVNGLSQVSVAVGQAAVAATHVHNSLS